MWATWKTNSFQPPQAGVKYQQFAGIARDPCSLVSDPGHCRVGAKAAQQIISNAITLLIGETWNYQCDSGLQHLQSTPSDCVCEPVLRLEPKHRI